MLLSEQAATAVAPVAAGRSLVHQVQLLAEHPHSMQTTAVLPVIRSTLERQPSLQHHARSWHAQIEWTGRFGSCLGVEQLEGHSKAKEMLWPVRSACLMRWVHTYSSITFCRLKSLLLDRLGWWSLAIQLHSTGTGP